MDRSKRNKIIMFLGSVVVAVMFITSYAAFGNNGGTTVTTTVKPTKTYYVSGSTNALVTGYGSEATLVLKNNSQSNYINLTLSKLESSNYIYNYNKFGNSYLVELSSNFSSYNLQIYLSNSIYSNSIQLNATENVKIPDVLDLYNYGSLVHIYTTNTNFSISKYVLVPINSIIPVNVQAIVTANGTVYNNSISVS